ncbi:Outer membrane protein porin (plasmid) [Paraburkholderia caribensis MBA4]|uniref:Outer membrane protein porin n=2 Tax=Paraburkholderia caribensis TaxID=75105 RepID=A0A0P0RN82_9BURK|nr:Outer membrane protein porin [Paraburkholderia caribensis MBA4]
MQVCMTKNSGIRRMKTRNLAILATALSSGAAYAQSSVTLFGLIDTGIAYTSNARSDPAVPSKGGTNWSMITGIINTSRWGLHGNESLGDGLSAIFWLESGFDSTNGAFKNGGDLFGRQAWVGVASHEYGSVTLGRQYDLVVDYLAPISATGSGFAANLAQHPYDNDNLNNNMRLNNAVKFSSAAFDGLQVGAMYAFSNEAGGFSNNNAYSLGARYARGPVTVSAAFLQVNRNAGQPNPSGAASTTDGDALTTGGRLQIYGAGAQYAFGKSSVGLVWTHSSTEDVTGILQGGSTTIGALHGHGIKFDNFEVNGQYFVMPAFSVGASYVYTMASFEPLAGTTARPHWNQVMAQANYRLSPRTEVFLEGTYQRVSGGNGNPVFDAGVFNLPPSTGSSQTVVTVGLQHRF